MYVRHGFCSKEKHKMCPVRYSRSMSSEMILERSETYEIISDTSVAGGRAIRCTVCYVKSYNPRDVRELYCSSCRASHSMLAARLQKAGS